MKDLEGLALVVTDAATKAAQNATKPLDSRVASISRSVKTSLSVTEKAQREVDEVKARLDSKIQDTNAKLSSIVANQQKSESVYKDAFSSVISTQNHLTGLLAALPSPIDENFKQIKVDIQDGLNSLEKDLTVLKQDYRNSVKYYNNAVSKLALDQEHLGRLVKELPEPIDANFKQLRSNCESIMAELSTNFVDLKGFVDSRIEEFDKAEQVIQEKGDLALKRIETLASETIDTVKDGVKGDIGEPGIRGPKGDPGSMNAPEGWTDQKLYKAGNTVTHRGGTWYCETTTADEPGDTPAWTCIANGVDTKEGFVEDGVFTQVYANGERVEYRVAPRNMGIYNQDDRYIKGDHVQNDYGTYEAKCDSPTQVPGKAIPDGSEPEWITIAGRGKRGQRGHSGDPKDAAAIVYAQLQKDLKEGANLLGDYLEGVVL